MVMNPLGNPKEGTTVTPVPSTSTTKLCTLCSSRSSAQPVKYTCPRCSLHTCSAACSSLHKRRDGCTGERDKVKFVPMKEYGYGALMNDYVYLEEVGRAVKERGRDICKGKYRVTERIEGGRRKKSKKEALQIQLEIREISLVLLPPGMERKKLNQSYCDSKQKKIYLTIELLFVNGHGTTDSLRLMTHKNDIDQPLLKILQTHVGDKLKQVAKQQGKSKGNSNNSTKTGTILEWLKELVFPDPPDQLEFFAPPLCLLQSSKPPTPSLPSSSFKRFKSKSYHSLDPFQKFSQSLRQKKFIEFPLIEIWEKDTFTDSGFAETNKHSGLYERVAEGADGMPRKRRKVEVMGKKRGEAVVRGLLGGYGSSEDEEDQDSPGVLDGLGQYEESEGDEELEELNPDTADVSEGSGSDHEVVDPAVLIQQLKSAGFVFDQVMMDDEDVDWGDDDL